MKTLLTLHLSEPQANAEPAADKMATPIEEKAKQVGDAAIPTADAASEDLKNVAASIGQVRRLINSSVASAMVSLEDSPPCSGLRLAKDRTWRV